MWLFQYFNLTKGKEIDRQCPLIALYNENKNEKPVIIHNALPNRALRLKLFSTLF